MENNVSRPALRNHYLISGEEGKREEALTEAKRVKKDKIGDYNVYWNNSLNVSKRGEGESCGLLIGNAVDPLCPKKRNEDILSEVLSRVNKGVTLGEGVIKYSGRFVLFLNKNGRYFLVNDAGATRPITYTNIGGSIRVSSSVSLILWCMNEQPIYSDRKKEFDRRSDFWIGSKTRDERIDKMLPNSYLYLNEMEVKRLTVRRCESYESSIEKMGQILRGTILGLNERFNLKIGLTSGVDSRMILAASEPISKEVEYFVFERNDVDNGDIKVANKMAKNLGLDFKSLRANKKVYGNSSYLGEVMGKNWVSSRDSLMGNILSINHHFDNCAVITGVMGEVFRCFYPSPYKNYSVDKIFECTQVERNDYSASEIKEWLESVREQVDENGVDIMDLFYWEQKVGNWGARSFVEYDLVTDTFSPFSNRMFILGMLSLPREGRRPPKYEACRRLVKYLWPACDRFSYNPGLYSLSKGWLQYYADKNPIFLKLYNSIKNLKNSLQN